MAENTSDGVLLPGNYDDFRKIKKISAPIARALYELGITRYADLARLTPTELAAMLLAKKVNFISVQRIEREDWPGQASVLASQADESTNPDESSLQTSSGAALSKTPEVDPQVAASRKGAPAESIHSDWRELADFFVSYGERIGPEGQAVLKTKVHYLQADRDKEWDGIATGELIAWMLGQSDLPHSVRPETALVEQPVQESEEVDALVVSNIWVSAINPSSQAEQRRVRIEAQVSLASEVYGVLPVPVSFTVSVYLVNTERGNSVFIENSPVETTANNLPHLFQQDVVVPPPGRYQLYLLARLIAPGSKIVLQPGPVVRVEG